MTTPERAIEFELTNFLSSFVKSNLGRGPRDTKIKIADNVLVFFLEGILSPLELNMLEFDEGERVVLEGRRLSVKKANKKRIAGLEEIVGSKVIDHYESWNLEQDSSVGVVVFERNILN